ncbi:MAG: tetratricopeptide repeat protein, partial [Helicobacteraceae bacterium]|nr:tetratricopeptide repeat protein [Helicobacteraceae bacterium]
MNKSLWTFFLIATSLLSLEISQIAGRYEGEQYSAILLSDNRPFECLQNDPSMQKGLTCRFDRVPAVRQERYQNQFFIVNPVAQGETFSLEIFYKHKAAVYPANESTMTANAFISGGETSSKRWLIVGFKETLPLLRGKNPLGLHFPIDFPAFEYPAIGALDVNGKPITDHVADGEGHEFAEILNMFENQSAPLETLQQINAILDASGGRHLFLPELIALKIKILDRLGAGHERELIELAEPWVENFTAHPGLAEVLLILGTTEQRIGLVSSALYRYETIMREFPETKFADLARIYKADRTLSQGRRDEAVQDYQTVLFNSQDIPSAALAASRLARVAISDDNIEKAAEYYLKILNTYPEFFTRDVEVNRRLLTVMAEQKLYQAAASLAEVLLPFTPLSEYERSLFDLARWQNLASYGAKSLETYERFIDEFPYSTYIELAKKERDLLLFAQGMPTDEENLRLYDHIITAYKDDEAASRALYEKVKLLMKMGRHREVQSLLPAIDRLNPKLFYDFSQQVRHIERVLLNIALKNGACADAVELVNSREFDLLFYSSEEMYGCAFLQRDFPIALEVVKNNIEKTSPAKAIVWFERRLDTYYAMSDYPRFIDEAERFLRMSKALRESVSSERYLQIFDVYRILDDDPARMLELGMMIEERFPKEPRLMDVYLALSTQAQRQGDVARQYEYAKKLINRHRLVNAAAFTPLSELVFADAAVKLGRSGEALLALESA